MKTKLYLFICFLFFSMSSARAQCTGTFNISSQSDIDNFTTNFGTCTDITGDIVVNLSSSFSNINFLSNVETVSGDLTIRGFSITNIEGLSNLTSVGGTFTLEFLPVTSLTNLSSLESVGSLSLNNVDTLSDLTGLENLTNIDDVLFITSNNLLTSISALDNVNSNLTEIQVRFNGLLTECSITAVCGALSGNGTSLTISSNATGCSSNSDPVLQLGCDICPTNLSIETQAELDNILPSIQSVCGSTLSGNLTLGVSFGLSDISDLSGLNFITSIDGSLILTGIDLTTPTGLDMLGSIGDDLRITNNPTLTDITALESVSFTENSFLTISTNPILSNCSITPICDNVDKLSVFGNDTGCNTEYEISLACGQCPLTINYISQADIDADIATIQSLCDAEFEGNIFLGNSGGSDINDISGFNFITSIGGSLRFGGTSLSDLSAFSNLTSVGSLTFFEPGFSVMTGLENLESIEFSLDITNTEFTSLQGLEGLTAITFISIRNNDLLTDVSQLSNVDPFTVNFLRVQNNLMLSECENPLFCSLIQNPYIDMELQFNNGGSCNSQANLFNACNAEDPDGDGTLGEDDNCPDMMNPEQTDTDTDGVGDACDNCPTVANADQADDDNDGIGNACAMDAGVNTGGVGVGNNDPKTKLQVTDGDVYIDNPNRGIIMKTASGKCFRVKPNDKGELVATEIPCP